MRISAMVGALVATAASSFTLGWWWCWKTRKRGSKQGVVHDVGSPTAAQVLALIKTRRSIFPKDYTGEVPPRVHLEQMLYASNWAPTHGKTEPWRFVVMEKDSVAKFFSHCSEAMKEKFGETGEKFLAYQAKQEKSKKDKAKSAYIIAICMKRKALPDKLMPEWEEIAATSCAVQNMHLMATALGQIE